MHPRDISRSALLLIAAVLAGCPGQQECPDAGGCEADTAPPALSSTVPAEGAVDVAPSAAVSLVFSEAMDRDALAAELTRAGSLEPSHRIPLTAQWSQGDTAVTLTPSLAMAFGTEYTLTVNGTDLAGNSLPRAELSFTVLAEPDTSTPTLLGTFPSAGAVKVPVDANVSFSFSEAIDRASLEGALTFSPALSCTFSWFNQDSLVRCDPEQTLAWNTTYTATLSVGVTDGSGNALEEPFVLTFTTEKEDQVAPVLLTSAPAEGAPGAARTPTLTLTFSEPMNQVSVQAAFRINSPAAPAPSSYDFQWNAEGTEVTVAPAVTYAYGELVQWELGVGATDLSENPFASPVQRSFQVRRLGSVILTGESALDGFVSKWPGGTNYSVTANSYASIGDNTANYSYRTFLSFGLIGSGKVPVDALAVTSATLSVYLTTSNGNPLGLGTPVVDHVHYGTALGGDDWGTPILGSRTYSMPANVVVGTKVLNVTGSVVDDFQQHSVRGDRSQFRIRTADTDNDGLNDWINYGTADWAPGPQLEVQYEYP